jgi:hypothetical protein
MAWSASIVKKERDAGGRLTVTVELADRGRTFTFRLSTDSAPTATWLVDQVADKVAQLDALDAWDAALPAVGAPIDYSTKGTPDPADVAREAWLADYRRKTQMEKAVDAGLLPADDPTFVALEQSVKAGFLPEYVTSIRG